MIVMFSMVSFNDFISSRRSLFFLRTFISVVSRSCVYSSSVILILAHFLLLSVAYSSMTFMVFSSNLVFFSLAPVFASLIQGKFLIIFFLFLLFCKDPIDRVFYGLGFLFLLRKYNQYY